MAPLHHLRPFRTALLCGAALTFAAGCSAIPGTASNASGHGHGGKGSKPATIEELATKTGCTLNSKRASQELRQGLCQGSKGRYTLVSFASDKNQEAWLEEAKPWGGTYLVGTRWVIVGTKPILETLHKDLGGEILNGEHHA